MPIYLIHFDKKYRHAAHYLGFAERDIEARVALHRSGHGARLMNVIHAAGIGFVVARTWRSGTRSEERKLKKRGGAARICPLCLARMKELRKTKWGD